MVCGLEKECQWLNGFNNKRGREMIKHKQEKLQLLLAVRQFVGKYSETAWKLVDELMADIERIDEEE